MGNKTNRLSLIEAALYSAGRPVELRRLKRLIGTTSDRVIKSLLEELRRIYKGRESALEIRVLPDGRAVMKLKGEFEGLVRRLARRALLTRGPLKTLSYIAYHQPIEQRMVIVERGRHAYTHLRLLEEQGLIARDRDEEGRIIVRTTPYFADYFGFSQNPAKIRLQLRILFNEMRIRRIDEGLRPSIPEV
jgi:segregation and condensation protein B